MSAPPVSSYHPSVVDMTRCIGRRTTDKMADRRWSFSVYRAVQCTAVRPADGDLCAKCVARRELPAATRTDGGWQGVVTDMTSLPADSHIAGSAWFLSGKPKWLGVERPKMVRHVPVVAAAAPAPAPPAPAAAAAEDGELKLIDGTLYMVRQGNVYEYDELTERSGDFCGRLTAEDTIDTEGEAIVAAAPEAAPAPAPKEGRRVLRRLLAEERAAHAATAARLAALELIHSRIADLIAPPPPAVEELN